MQIDVITFRASYNFGSALQAFAMQAFIKSLGHEPAVVDYVCRDQEQYVLLSPLHPRRTPRNLKNFRSYHGWKAAFERFQRVRLGR